MIVIVGADFDPSRPAGDLLKQKVLSIPKGDISIIYHPTVVKTVYLGDPRSS